MISTIPNKMGLGLNNIQFFGRNKSLITNIALFINLKKFYHLNQNPMFRIVAAFLGFVLLTTTLPAQQPVEVTEQTLKIGGLKEEEFYFGFAAGDKIVLNFKEVDNKELKEIEIVEYPNNPRYADYKVTFLENKTIEVPKQGVYIFRFKNTALTGRICKIKVQRIPASAETAHFNTSVTWEDRDETTYKTYTKEVIAGYDTTYIQKTKKVLVKTEQKEELIFDKPQRVHSNANLSNHNKTSLSFKLPLHQISPYKTTKVIAWAYWVGVGKEANLAWKQNAQIIKNIVKGAVAYFTTPLGALAAGVVTDLATPKAGEDVYYAIANQTNKDLFVAGQKYTVYDQGKGVAGYRKFTEPSLCQGTYYVLLSNDNLVQAIDATVKVVAILETNVYEEQPYSDIILKPRYETKTFSEPVIKTSRVPVTGN